LELGKRFYTDDASWQKEYTPATMAISEELEGIGCLSTEEKGQQYNCTTTTPLLHSSCVQ